MPEQRVNGTTLYYELHGQGEPLVLVHGSWTDGTGWGAVIDGLAESFRVLVYDRRGHSRSERPETQGSIDEDGDDLGELIESLGLAPAHVLTSSFGGNIALRLATRREELFRSLSCHEPPLWGVLGDEAADTEERRNEERALEEVAERIAAGDHAGAAQHFVDEIAFGPGAWENQIPPHIQEVFVRNAPTYLDEMQDPDQTSIDEDALASLSVRLRLTVGTESPPTFRRVVDRIAELVPGARRETFVGASHGPQVSMPDRYVEVTTRALRAIG